MDRDKVVNGIIAVLITVDIILLILITFYNFNPAVVSAIIYFDLIVCGILFVEFVFRIRKEEDKWLFMKENWPDIIAMIPFEYFFLRMFRFFRVIRLYRSVRLLALFRKDLNVLFRFLHETHIDYALGIVLFSIFAGTILFYLTEVEFNMAISSLWDSFWYSMTYTVVGGSDIAAKTLYGRLITLALIIIGVTFIGLLTASIATWIMEQRAEKSDKNIERRLRKIEKSLDHLNREIKKLNRQNK